MGRFQTISAFAISTFTCVATRRGRLVGVATVRQPALDIGLVLVRHELPRLHELGGAHSEVGHDFLEADLGHFGGPFLLTGWVVVTALARDIPGGDATTVALAASLAVKRVIRRRVPALAHQNRGVLNEDAANDAL